jgi:hypothetical protein
MASKSSRICSGVEALARIARVERSESSVIAFWLAWTSSSSTFQSGFSALSGLLAIHVANPSFNQMSSHHCIVTRSPNHWCAISCASTPAMSLRSCTEADFESASSSVSR